jgi:hypothetical protein
VVRLIPVERKEDAFNLHLLTACSIFRLQLPFECIIFCENYMESQRVLSGSSFGFKASLVLFLLFEFGDCSTISHVMVVLVTIVTPHVGNLRILQILAYTTVNRLIRSYHLLLVGALVLLQILLTLEIRN